MPTTDLISPFVVSCAGGLTLNKDVFSMQPGESLILQNFEPDIKGGYRRVSGTALYNTTQIPQGSSNTSKVIDCSIIFNGQVIVARGGDIHRGTTSGSFTTLTTGLGTSTRSYDFEKFNFDGTEKIIIATGHSPAQLTTKGDIKSVVGIFYFFLFSSNFFNCSFCLSSSIFNSSPFFKLSYTRCSTLFNFATSISSLSAL